MKTTINIHTDILGKITYAAQCCGISRSKMIIKLMSRVIDNIQNYAPLGSPVKYQKKCKSDGWHRFHIRLGEEEYEHLLDLRKVMKMSVSLILADAVEKYLIEILKINNSDNYRFNNYRVSLFIHEGVKVWKIIWGLVSNIEKIIPI